MGCLGARLGLVSWLGGGYWLERRERDKREEREGRREEERG